MDRRMKRLISVYANPAGPFYLSADSTRKGNVEMKIEIWSDVVCPFCYIGKRKLENALEQFSPRDDVEILWHSFQLDPSAKREEGKDIYDHVAEKYGQDREWALNVNRNLVENAKKVGLDYRFERVIPANTFDAHRMIHLAATHGLQEKAEERFFAAYFTEGKDLGDPETLVELIGEIGLDRDEARRTVESTDYADAVRGDIQEAESLGINAVPFFVFDRRYAISGAQPTHLFLETLQKVSAGE